MTLEIQKTDAGLPILGDDQIKQIYAQVLGAEHDYALKAIIFGQILTEKRAEMATQLGMLSHSGKASLNGHKLGDQDGFSDWLDSVGVSSSKAYRWMAAADRVMRKMLDVRAGDDIPALDVDGEVIPLSRALAAPDGDTLPDAAREFQQSVFDFLADKTLSEAVACAVDGESPANRIGRAANGQAAKQTKGDARKDYPFFLANKLQDVSTHLEHWDSMTKLQKSEACLVLRAALLGSPMTLSRKGDTTFAFSVWPDEVREIALESLNKIQA
jgi:hypothetical protein